jgi:oxalate decarboxylase
MAEGDRMNQKSRSSILPLEHAFKFDLASAKPSIHEHGNTVREANADDFPVLKGNAVAFFMIHMRPGALRVPHWHPNAWELDYCLEGEARFWITGPDNTRQIVKQVIDLKPGEIVFIPQGWFHAIKAINNKELKLLLTFNNGMPTDIGIPVGLDGMGNNQFAQTFEVSPEVFNNFNRNNKFFAPPVKEKSEGKKGRR